MDSALFTVFRKDFFALVDASPSIIITSHYSPDDDSIGSVLSMYHILATARPEKTIRIVYTGASPVRYAVIAGFQKIEWVDDVAKEIHTAALVVYVDANQYTRFSKNLENFTTDQKSVCIDHHASAPDVFTLLLGESQATSTCELIYHAFALEQTISKDLAETILLGILGDTGNFAYVPPAQSQVFLVAKKLIETIGMPIDAFRSRYGGIPKQIIPLLQELVAHTTYIAVDGWPDGQYTYINSIGSYSDEDMSAASHIYMGQYLPRVKGYDWGFVITPRADGTCRMSGRSLPGSVNVRDFHERMGIGGGHDRASGGYFTESDPQTCIAKVLDWMKANKPLIG